MRNDIVEILCDINPLLDPDDEDMSIAEFLESKRSLCTFRIFIFVLFLVMIGFITEQLKPLSRR